MTGNDKKWIGLMLLSMFIGYVIGLFIKHTILALFYTMVAVLIANFITPLCMVVAIFIFLNIYNKNK